MTTLNLRVKLSDEAVNRLVTGAKARGFVRTRPRAKWTQSERIMAAAHGLRVIIERETNAEITRSELEGS